MRLWERRREPWPGRIVDFVASGLPFLATAPLLYASPTMQLVSGIYWDQRGKIDGLMYVIANYSDISAFALVTVMITSMVWAIRHRVLRFHPLVLALLIVGGLVYLNLPRIMFDTYMTDQRVPIGVAFMMFACGDLELRRRLVRRGFMVVLIILVAARLIEIDVNWTQLSDSTSEFRSSVRRIAPGSKVFVAYADRSLGEDVRDLGLVHAACIATIERSALVTTLFTVAGKQIVHARPQFSDFVDARDGTPPSTAQLGDRRRASVADDAEVLAELAEVRLSLRPVHRGRRAQSRSGAPAARHRWRPFPALSHHQDAIAVFYLRMILTENRCPLFGIMR